jgi:hypothetical protein
MKWRGLALFHIPCVLWGAMIEFRGWICPLTPLENFLRKAAGEEGYAGGFVDRYIVPLVYPANLTRDMQVQLGVAVLAINVVLYYVAVFRMRRTAGGGE